MIARHAGTSIGIVDYGMGNLRSVEKALEPVGAHAPRHVRPRGGARAPTLVLPGSARSGDAKRALGLDGSSREPSRKRPVLGICLGLQVLFESAASPGARWGSGCSRDASSKLAPAS